MVVDLSEDPADLCHVLDLVQRHDLDQVDGPMVARRSTLGPEAPDPPIPGTLAGHHLLQSGRSRW